MPGNLSLILFMLVVAVSLPAMIALGVVLLTRKESLPALCRAAAERIAGGILLVAWVLSSTVLLPWFFPIPQLLSLAIGVRLGLASRGTSWTVFPATFGPVALAVAASTLIEEALPLPLASHFFCALLSFVLARHFPRELAGEVRRLRVFLAGGLIAVVLHTALVLATFFAILLTGEGRASGFVKDVLLAVDFPLLLVLAESLAGTPAGEHLTHLGETLGGILPGLNTSVSMFLVAAFGAFLWFVLGGIAGLVAGRKWLSVSWNRHLARFDRPSA